MFSSSFVCSVEFNGKFCWKLQMKITDEKKWKLQMKIAHENYKWKLQMKITDENCKWKLQMKITNVNYQVIAHVI